MSLLEMHLLLELKAFLKCPEDESLEIVHKIRSCDLVADTEYQKFG